MADSLHATEAQKRKVIKRIFNRYITNAPLLAYTDLLSVGPDRKQRLIRPMGDAKKTGGGLMVAPIQMQRLEDNHAGHAVFNYDGVDPTDVVNHSTTKEGSETASDQIATLLQMEERWFAHSLKEFERDKSDVGAHPRENGEG